MAVRKKKQAWRVGSLFAIPLSDGSCCLGQVVGQESAVLNSVSIALFEQVFSCGSGGHINPESEKVFSVIFTTRDLLDSGRWLVVGESEVAVSEDMLPFEHLRDQGFVGANVYGSANVEEFANAFYGFVPWDDWQDPEYLDKLLISPDKKPFDRLIYKSA